MGICHSSIKRWNLFPSAWFWGAPVTCLGQQTVAKVTLSDFQVKALRFLAAVFMFLEQSQCHVRKLNLVWWMMRDHPERPRGKLRLPLAPVEKPQPNARGNREKNCQHGTLLKFLIHKLLAIRYLAVFLSHWVCYIAIGNWNMEEKTSLNNEMCKSFNLEKTHFEYF